MMKRNLLLMVLAIASPALHAYDTGYGTVTASLRAFYMDRDFDREATPNARALTLGGIVKYESPALADARVGLAWFGNHRLGGLYSRQEGMGTGNLQGDGDDIAFLGEAYLSFSLGRTSLRLGRQRLDTPLANDHDLRALPSTYEALRIRNGDLPDTTLELGHIRAYSGFVSKLGGFDRQTATWGDDGLAYLYVRNASLKPVELRAQYVHPIDTAGLPAGGVKGYWYADAATPLWFGSRTSLELQSGGNRYIGSDDSLMLGARLSISPLEKLEVALVGNRILDNRFRVIESGPMYTDWQQGYGRYEPSLAYGGYLLFKPIQGFSVKAGVVKVEADAGYSTDDYVEQVYDLQYAVAKNTRVRLRYSIKDQSGASTREDRDDFRIILYQDFP